MLKKALEEKGIIIKNELELAEILKAATEDIKFNNISFKRRTSFADVVNIAAISAITLKRCN